MKVQCNLCEYEKEGFCLKKTQGNKPQKIQLNKRRTCSLYSEAPLKVLADYRKGEAHKQVLKSQMMQKVRYQAFVRKQEAQSDAILKDFKGVTDV
jgi:hypothetical protein